MNCFWKLVSTVGFVGSLAMASPKTSSQSGHSLNWEVSQTKIEAKLGPGFHFNLSAPNQLVVDGRVMKASQASERSVVFESKEGVKGKVTVFVCDDQKTFCERHEKSLGAELGLGSGAKVSSQLGDRAGLFSRTLERARKSGRLVLVDFYARWCPGCVRYEQEVFGTREFKALTSELEVVKVDLDVFENQVIAEKYGVRFIPTLIVLDSQGREIDRLVDFQPIGKLSAFLQAAVEDPVPVEVLLSGERILPTERLQKGRRLVSAGRFKAAIDLLKDLEPRPLEFYEAQVEFARDPKSGELKSALREAIQAHPKSFKSLSWRTELLGLLEDLEEKRKIFAEGSALAKHWLNDSDALAKLAREESFGEGAGFEMMYVAIAQAELAEAFSPESPEQAWLQASEVVESLNIPTTKKGPSMRRLVVLVQSKRFEKAKRLAESLLKSDPSNPEIQRRLVRILVELKSYQSAIKLGKSALKKSYGRNEIWVAEQLVKAYLGQGQKVEAKKLLDEYLSRPEVSFPNMKSTKSNLENLKAKIN